MPSIAAIIRCAARNRPSALTASITYMSVTRPTCRPPSGGGQRARRGSAGSIGPRWGGGSSRTSSYSPACSTARRSAVVRSSAPRSSAGSASTSSRRGSEGRAPRCAVVVVLPMPPRPMVRPDAGAAGWSGASSGCRGVSLTGAVPFVSVPGGEVGVPGGHVVDAVVQRRQAVGDPAGWVPARGCLSQFGHPPFVLGLRHFFGVPGGFAAGDVPSQRVEPGGALAQPIGLDADLLAQVGVLDPG